jgi:hypothetical protein
MEMLSEDCSLQMNEDEGKEVNTEVAAGDNMLKRTGFLPVLVLLLE